MKYDPKSFEDKWKEKWLKDKLYKANFKDTKSEKFYSLYSYPYPSGAGLHVGHSEGMVANDIMARYWRMKGSNVVLPMGWDSFGLPAENYAIKTGVPPQQTTDEAVQTFKKQINNLGISVDWNTEVGAHWPEYYKWTQWIFIQLFNKGLAYKKKAPVNWCPKDQTVLANEQVINGHCERCDTLVVQKDMEQWFFKITDFADRLDKDLDKVDWPESTKATQRNWIGKSVGAEIVWDLENPESKEKLEIKTFTTRFDTIPGPTFLVVAAEYMDIEKLITSKQKDEVMKYVTEVKNKTDLERVSSKEKTGVFTGSNAINPFNGESVPIYVTDYVLATYGTGAVMGMPGHDQRDFEFAKKFDLPIKYTLKPKEKDFKFPTDKAFEGEGFEINSGEFDGLWWEDAREKIIDKLEKDGKAIRVTNYKIRDWLLSRQRYWGCPIPILYKELSAEEQKLQDIYSKDPELVFTFHAWESSKDKNFHPYIDKSLEEKSIKSITPNLPNPSAPVMEEWLSVAEKELKGSSENIVITGRSLGCWSALKLAETRKIRKLILVAPTTPAEFVTPTDRVKELLKDKKTKEVFEKFDSKVDFEKVKENVGEILVYLSTTDPYIPLKETKEYLEKNLPNTGFRIVKDADHFNSDHGYDTFPELLEEILKPVRLDIKPVPESDLPVLLPTDVDFLPTGESPMTRSVDFKKRAEEKYGKGWHYEYDTMDTFVDSSWYFFRHIDAQNKEKIFDAKLANYWLPTDLYMIGAEHIVLHLLYARFFTKFFFDQGIINFDEPFQKMRHMGTILGPDGRKMSKRWGNVINPNDEIAKYSADSVRMYEMFMGPLQEAKPWNDRSENGVFRFLNRVWDLSDKIGENTDKNQTRLANKLIKKISDDTEILSFNTAIARFMEFVNAISEFEKIDKSVWEMFLKTLAPYAPFITEELWDKLGNDYSIHKQEWPKFDPELIKDDVITMGVQINGKVRGTIQINPESEEKDAIKLAKTDEKINKYLTGKPKKVIYIKGKILNIII